MCFRCSNKFLELCERNYGVRLDSQPHLLVLAGTLSGP